MTRCLSFAANFILFSSAIAAGQEPKLKGYVLDDKGHAVSGVAITIPGGDDTTTDSDGHFTTNFRNPIKPGEPIRIFVANWVVFEPMFGRTSTQSLETNGEPLPVIVVLKRSPRFLEPARLSLLVAEIQIRISLASTLGDKPREAQRERDTVLLEYATDSGFPLDKLETAIDEWSQITKSENNEEEARKSYWRKNYLKAGELYLESARDDTAEKQVQRAKIRKYVAAGNAFDEGDEFRRALAAFLELDRLFETGRFNKAELKTEWAELKLFIAKAKIGLGERIAGEEYREMLKGALAQCEQAETVYSRDAFPERWARMKQIMSWVFITLGERLGGTESFSYFDQGVKALRESSEVLSREKFPQAWAGIQQNLGLVFGEFSDRTTGADRSKYLSETIKALRSAQEVFSREKVPEDWALMQNSLGMALLNLSEEADDKEAIQYLNEAITGYREAIAIDFRKPLTERWASDQGNLGVVLKSLSLRSKKPAKVALLKEAIVAYNESLKFYTLAKFPQDWATSQNGLANALGELAEESSRPEKVKYLEEAVGAFGEILHIWTREQFPRNWAKAQNNLGTALLHLSSTDPTKSIQYLNDAASAYKEALKVYDPVYAPKDWGDSWNSLGIVFGVLAAETQGADRIQFLKDSASAFETSLKARTLESSPYRWARTQMSISLTLQKLAEETDDESEATYLKQAETAAQNALRGVTKESFPEEWALAQFSLGRIENFLSRRMALEQKVSYLRKSETALRNALAVDVGNDQQEHRWVADKLELAGTLYALGMQSDRDERFRYLTEAVTLYRSVLTVKDRESFPPRWQGMYLTLGGALETLSRDTTGEPSTEYLRDAVTSYRDGLQVHQPLSRYWAELQHSLGSALIDLSRIVDRTDSARFMKEAMTALRGALQFYTRELGAETWADTEFRLGSVLFDFAMNTGEKETNTYLGEAETALKNALQVFTKEKSPKEWSNAHLNLGLTLYYLGMQTDGEKRTTHLKGAQSSFGLALEFFTREQAPRQWAQIQTHLARSYFTLENWSQARETCSLLLQHYPDDKEAYGLAAHIDHERLFKFDSAFALTQHWLETHADDLEAQMNFAENHFTTGRFSECERRVRALLARTDVPNSERAALRAIEIASLLANNQTDQAPIKLDALIAEIENQPLAFKVSWSFDGTRHFIEQNQKLLPQRGWLFQMLDSLAGNDRDTILKAMREARANFKLTGSPQVRGHMRLRSQAGYSAYQQSSARNNMRGIRAASLLLPAAVFAG